MLDQLEALDEQFWRGHSRVFEDVTSILCGLGIGLRLGAPPNTTKHRLGFVPLALCCMLHLYALATAQKRRSLFGR
jgi:hypothetical protein